MNPNLISKAAYARLRGCDEKAVRKAVIEGRISLIDGKIDREVADIQWARNTRARVSQSPAARAAGQADIETVADAAAEAVGPIKQASGPSAEPGYVQFRSIREEADADIAQMTAGKMRGTMVMRDRVDNGTFEVGREIRDRLTACARRIAAEVASINTAEGCEVVVDREHRIVLELLVAAFREKLGAPPRDAE